MKNGVVVQLRKSAITVFLFFLGAAIAFLGVVSADDGAENANRMLDNLKRRSADERWQRVKRLYPFDSSTSRNSSPARLHDDRARALSDDLIPPSPEQTPLIPRLSSLPADGSSDWILPARPSAIEDGDNVPFPETTFSNDTTATEIKATRIAAQGTELKPSSEDGSMMGQRRNIRARSISEIIPDYDRDRDSDIREFAIEQGKEYDILFKANRFEERSFPQMSFAWEASNLTYSPLYFSDSALERYGHTYHPWIQPWASIARFGTQFVMLPYQMTIDPPCCEVTPLGWYRPGDCAPKLHYQAPLNAEAAVVEAAVVTGLFFVIP